MNLLVGAGIVVFVTAFSFIAMLLNRRRAP